MSLVPKHQLIVPSTLLALATNIPTYKDTKPQRYKATKIHTLTQMTYELFFSKKLKKAVVYLDAPGHAANLVYQPQSKLHQLPRTDSVPADLWSLFHLAMTVLVHCHHTFRDLSSVVVTVYISTMAFARYLFLS